MDQGRQPEGGEQEELALRAIDRGPVDVAPDVGGERVLGPLPLLERLRVELELARRRGEADARLTVHLDADRSTSPGDEPRGRIHGRARQVLRPERRLVRPVDAVLDEERAVLPHVGQRREPLLRGRLRQSGHGVLEHPAVELVHRELLARPGRRLEPPPDAERAVRVDPPGELDPELVLFPDLPEPRGLVRLPGRREPAALPLERDAQHGLAEADPARSVGLLAHEVVPLGGVTHREDVVGEPRSLAPGRRQADVEAHLRLVRERVDPGKAVGVRPHGVVDAGEVHVELPAPLLQQVREQEAHLEEGQRVLARVEELAPHLGRRRHERRRGDRLVVERRRRPARRRHRADEDAEELESPRHLPAPEVAGGGVAPDVGREGGAGPADLARDLDDGSGGDARLPLGELRRVRGIERRQDRLEGLEGLGLARVLLAEVVGPVHPAPEELPVVEPLLDHQLAHREEEGGLRARPGREPVVGHRGRVAEPRVDGADLRPPLLPLDDPLGVRVEVMARLEVRREEEDEARVGVVGRGPVEAAPEGVAGARRRRADVGVRVVAVDPPGVEDPLVVDELVARPPHVVHDLVPAPLLEGRPDPPREVVQHLVPRHARPLAAAPLPHALQGIADPLGVVDLVQGRRPLGAVASPAPRMLRVPLELLDLARVAVDVGEEAARRLAVEADGGDEAVMARDLSWPRLRVVLLPVVPARDGRVALEATRRRRQPLGGGVERLGTQTARAW